MIQPLPEPRPPSTFGHIGSRPAPSTIQTAPIPQTKNCLSIDVEGFVESNVQSFSIDAHHVNQVSENYEIERNVDVTLALLSDLRLRATFFFLGRIARDIPAVVRSAADAGHEIASHGFAHIRISSMSAQAFRTQVLSSKHRLEDVSGTRVYGYRAPDFSIIESTLWALDVLGETGFLYDSSIFPFGYHDVYGVGQAKPFVHRLPNGLIEFPPSTAALLGTRVPFGGGGYFRLYPLAITKLLMAHTNRRGQPCMFYIHPYEMGPILPRIAGLPWHRVVRHYHNCAHGLWRFQDIARGFAFSPAVEILRSKGLLDA